MRRRRSVPRSPGALGLRKVSALVPEGSVRGSDSCPATYAGGERL
jgi:hypothetical protein